VRDDSAARPQRADLPAAAAVALLAAAVRLAYLAAFGASPLAGLFKADQAYYRDWGLSLAAGDWVSPAVFEQGPLYAYLLGALYRLAGPRDQVVLLLQLLAGVATALLVWAVARRVFGSRAALAAGLLAAVYGPLVFHEGLVMKTWLEPLLALAALLAGLRFGDAHRARWLAAAGAAVGLACLVREIHALLLVPLLLWCWFAGARAGLGAGRRARAGAAAVLAFLLAIAPATLRNCVTARECVPVTTGGGEVAYLAFGPHASAYYSIPPFVRPLSRIEHQDFRDEAVLRSGGPLSRREASGWWLRETLRTVRDTPARPLGLLAGRVRALLNDFEFPDNENFATARRVVPLLGWLPTFGWVAGLAALGVAWALRAPARSFLPLAFAAAVALEVLLSYPFGRFRLALAPLLLPFAGHALDRLARLASSGAARDRLKLAAAVSVAALATAAAYLPPPVAADDRWVLRDDGKDRLRAATRAMQRLRIEELKAAVHADASDAPSWVELAAELERAGTLFEARAALRAALAADPASAGANRALAELYYRQGRVEPAAEHGRRYLRERPEDSRGHTGLAVYCSRLADETPGPAAADALRQEAAAHFAEARRLDPGNAEVWFYGGKYLALAGDRQGAGDLLSRALELKPDHAEARRVLGLVRANLARAALANRPAAHP
jgi:Flp pilus assembly protein TadD